MQYERRIEMEEIKVKMDKTSDTINLTISLANDEEGEYLCKTILQDLENINEQIVMANNDDNNWRRWTAGLRGDI